MEAPHVVEISSDGNIIIVDTGHYRIRMKDLKRDTVYTKLVTVYLFASEDVPNIYSFQDTIPLGIFEGLSIDLMILRQN